MKNRTRRMNQPATFWGPGTDDGLGSVTYPAPRVLTPGVRWEERGEQFSDPEGKEDLSRAVVYTPEPLPVGGWLALGVFTEADPKALDGAWKIRQTATIPNLRGTEQLSNVWL